MVPRAVRWVPGMGVMTQLIGRWIVIIFVPGVGDLVRMAPAERVSDARIWTAQYLLVMFRWGVCSCVSAGNQTDAITVFGGWYIVLNNCSMLRF